MRLLTVDQKLDGVGEFRGSLLELVQNPQNFPHRFVIVNKMWILHVMSESKKKCEQCLDS